MYQPGTTDHFPTFFAEVAVTHEDRERLLSDAEEKYFTVHTSIQCWLGIKILRQQPETFWAGWGRRANAGYGLRLEEQTEDATGVSTFFSVAQPANGALPGQFTIPANYIFHPLPVPPALPQNLIIPFEEIREAVEYGLSLM
jgi:hypothetical protein